MEKPRLITYLYSKATHFTGSCQSLGWLGDKCRSFSTAPWVSDTINDEYLTFPRETERNQYAVNWALAKLGVPPKGQVFYNTPARTIVANSPEKLSSRERHVLVSSQTTEHQELILGKNLKPREYAKALKAVTSSLSQADSLFVLDGAIGSHPQAEVRIRTVTDSPSVALFLHHMLEPIPVRPISQLNVQLYSYIHTRHMATSGIFSSPCSLLATDRGQLVVDGSNNMYRLLLSLTEMASQPLFQMSEAFILKSVWKNGRLILGRFENPTSGSVDPEWSDYGYYHHILSNQGCSRTLKGYILSSEAAKKQQSAEYAISLAGKYVAQSLSPRPPNLISLPRYCVIVNTHQNKGPLEVFSLTDDSAALTFLIASESLVTQGSILPYAQSLLSLLRRHQIPLYLVSGENAWQQAAMIDFATKKTDKEQLVNTKMLDAAKKYAQQVYGHEVFHQEKNSSE
ncbi:hypothetical protein GpartN1_g5302.t1 [Galdieria partita]|uniref:Phosphoenolpyruvate carboxykinase (ATP) n=1 Tax=Galdieria partita TaxID=83374 RepID=A0A9C7US06_9RHOD|nr:hypothetical protein GpartN1_g5302.t1 [Galdieria partita]